MTHSTALSAAPMSPALALSRAAERLAAIEAEAAGLRADLSAAASALAAPVAPIDPMRALTLGEVGAQLGLGRTSVTNLISAGALPSLLVGGSRRVLRRDLDAILERARAA